MNNYAYLSNFLFEMASADHVMNAGWSLLRTDTGQSLSQHLFRTAIIAYILAIQEKKEKPEKAALGALLNRIQQTRIGDRHKVTAAYLDKPADIKERVRNDQFSLLPKESKEAFQSILDLSEDQKVVIKDADQLSFALEAKLLVDKGYERAQIWIDRIEQVLVTPTAKKVLASIKKTHYCDWWEHLKIKPQTRRKNYISQI